MAKLSFLIVPLFLASFAYCLDDEIEERFRGMQNLMKTMQTSIDQLKQQVKETEEKCQVGNADFRRFVLDGEAPESVGFTAFVTAPDLLSLGHQHTIKFDYAETNVGNAYHTHTGVFIAPLKGMYVFHASAMSAPGQDQYLTFMKDGRLVSYVYPDARGTSGYQSSSNLWVLELDVGSETWLQTSGAGQIHGNNFTTFSGFLLNEM
ncbi:complement C1q-like protein 4 [Mya arenaria]|uniref:complement C1q-like protein 4 n=1 Tax=Mya arenaria TaxID=6604 RepID=UPI0022E044A9|nr:complement C1q-like protein 4 [Mya arenaria]